ncbi:MAG TPA: sugar ABC transporter substrate-binding protein [Bacillales bacterium]
MKHSVRSLFLLFLVAVLLVFAGCSSSQSGQSEQPKGGSGEEKAEGSSTGQTKTIEFMTIALSPTFDDYINGVIDAFEAKHQGVKVKWSDEPYGQIEQLVLTKASSNSLPDVINLNTLFLKKLAGLGALVNMDEAAADVKSEYFDGIWKSGNVEGASYAIPWYVSTSGLLYNTKLMEQAGITEPPKTFKEAWKDSAIIKEKTGAYGRVLTPRMHVLMPLNGIPIVSEDATKVTLNTPEAVEYWTFLKKQYDKGLIPKGVLLGQTKVPELYAQGKVAFWSTGPQLFRQVKDLSPKVYKQSKAAPALFGEANVQSASIMNLAVPTSSKNKDIAVEFAEFVTNAKNQLVFCKEANILPSIKEAAESDYFNKGKDSTDPAVKGNYFAAQQLDSAVDTSIPDKNASKIAEIVNKTFQRVLFQDEPVKDALASAEQKINSLLQE